MFVGCIVAGVTNSQRVDREQVEADWWFGRLHGQLLRLIEWADIEDRPIDYVLTAKGRVEGCGQAVVLRGIDDFFDLVDD